MLDVLIKISVMNRKIVISLISVFLLCTLTLLIIIRWSNKPNVVRNGFARQILISDPQQLHKSDIATPLYQLAGSSGNKLFFYGIDPRLIFITDTNLKIIDTIRAALPLSPKTSRAFEIIIDSAHLDFYAKNLAEIARYDLNDLTKISQVVQIQSPILTRIVPISPEKIALRAFDSSQRFQVFKIANRTNGEILKATPVRDTLAQDGGFASDGLIKYDELSNRIIYMNFYNNEFICMDTSLNIVYEGHTIDTFSNTNVAVRNSAALRKEGRGSIMPSVPLKVINKECDVSDGKLYIMSRLKADNENTADFDQNSNIDIYDIATGSYRGSFYIPNANGKKARSFRVFNNYIVALYGESVIKYSLPSL